MYIVGANPSMLKSDLFSTGYMKDYVKNEHVLYNMVHQKRTLKNIKKIRRKFANCTIIVVRYSNGQLVNSRPCLHCANILKIVGVKQVIYSNANGKMIKEKMTHFSTSHVSRLNRV